MHSKTCISSLVVFLSFLVISINATDLETLCGKLPLCKSLFPKTNPATVHDDGRNSLHNSISMTRDFTSLVNQYLNSDVHNHPQSTVRALEDCQALGYMTQDFLSRALRSVLGTDTLQTSKSEEIHTLLSATITNYETCQAGLQEVGADSVLLDALSGLWSNARKSCSVSLALFRLGWGVLKILFPWFRYFNPGQGNQGVVPIGVNASRVVYVNPNPGPGQKPDFRNITDAVNAAPINTEPGNGYYVISIAEGVYEEYVSIPRNKTYIMMIGAGMNKTVITGNRSVVDGWTTFNSASFVVLGKGFVAQKITFQNTAGAIKGQAVALRSGADLSAFYQCIFEGYQDTLYTHSMRQFYKKCDIYGTVDFIFGDAAVVFQDCNIYPRLPRHGQFNAITAQGRSDINQNTGTSIQGCTITPASNLASDGGTVRTYLGRPWKTFSRTVVMQSYLDKFINPAGWSIWSGNDSLDTLYYAEYNNTGPGSVTDNRVDWSGFHLIDATKAADFTVSQFIVGSDWLNGTGIPFYSGLK